MSMPGPNFCSMGNATPLAWRPARPWAMLMGVVERPAPSACRYAALWFTATTILPVQ